MVYPQCCVRSCISIRDLGGGSWKLFCANLVIDTISHPHTILHIGTIGPTIHWFYERTPLHFTTGPSSHWSYNPMNIRPIGPTKWKPNIARPIGPTTDVSDEPANNPKALWTNISERIFCTTPLSYEAQVEAIINCQIHCHRRRSCNIKDRKST